MLPPLLEIFVVWHPDDRAGASLADHLIDHFHGPAFSGLIGGAVEVFVRSEGWDGPLDAPRPLPGTESTELGVTPAKLTVVVPVLGRRLGRATEEGGPWRDYLAHIVATAAAAPDRVCLLPTRLENAPRRGVLVEMFGGLQSIDARQHFCREIAQGVAQFLRGEGRRLTVFLSHTKRAGDGADAPLRVVRRVRELLLDTRLAEFFDASDLQSGQDWQTELLAKSRSSALLIIRTDLYASRRWCQTEVLAAKRAGMPVVTLDALSTGEERGSFLMDHVPRIPLRATEEDDGILTALGQLVDECLKRELWKQQRDVAEQEGSVKVAWWAPHAPEPSTLVEWLLNHPTLDDQGGALILHPDPPLGRDELGVLEEIASLGGHPGKLEITTPRGLAIRGE